MFKSPCWHLMAGTHQTTFIPKFKGIKTTLRLWRHSGPQAPHIISALLRSPSPPVLTDHPTSLTVQTPRPSPFSANAITFFKPLFLRLRNKDPRLSHQKSQATGPKSYSPEVAKLGLDRSGFGVKSKNSLPEVPEYFLLFLFFSQKANPF